jgi:uncharacterized membrane protein
MDLINVPLALAWQSVGFALMIPVLLWAIWTAPWSRFASEGNNVWFGAILGLALLWSIKASLASGLVFHLLGVSLLTLMAGPQLALVGVAMVVAIATVLRDGLWASFAIDVVVTGAVPVMVTVSVLRAAERWLAPNFFVYIFVAGFFGAALGMLAAGIIAAAIAVLAVALPAGVVAEQFLPYLIYLGLGEATITGMLLTLLVVYKPAWVSTFDDARYLGGRLDTGPV